MGGVSGPAILPIAVRCVYEIYASVKIPIIGMGGVTTVNDIVQMFMAGATLVGLGTITYTKGMKVIIELKQQLSNYMDQNNIKDIKELICIDLKFSKSILKNIGELYVEALKERKELSLSCGAGFRW